MNTARTEQLIINSYKMKFQEIFSSLSSKFSNRESFDAIPKSIGDWILFVPPTPLNNFVTLNWKSTNISKKEILKLEESVHYLKLEGKIMEPVECIDDEKMEFQRIFFEADDEGILSFDFPKKLEFEKERKFDCTILIIPGRAEGSGESKIRRLVCDCLDKHLFPIVMNPRGCADSPVITPRLFTAADSSDISFAVEYIILKRPWTTLMAVGWEYGANMLTKYLAESGDETRIAAAACIDNPFDLEEATRSSVCHQVFDRSLRDGLIKILQNNKEVFEGPGKNFDIKSAFTAPSVRDFERAISIFSHGFYNIEDFYAKSSTRNLIEKVKVPVLFIQNDYPTVPFASIPRSEMVDNPCTSLILCSYNSSVDEELMLSWCHHLILEWLMAVELALPNLKAP